MVTFCFRRQDFELWKKKKKKSTGITLLMKTMWAPDQLLNGLCGEIILSPKWFKAFEQTAFGERIISLRVCHCAVFKWKYRRQRRDSHWIKSLCLCFIHPHHYCAVTAHERVGSQIEQFILALTLCQQKWGCTSLIHQMGILDDP